MIMLLRGEFNKGLAEQYQLKVRYSSTHLALTPMHIATLALFLSPYVKDRIRAIQSDCPHDDTQTQVSHHDPSFRATPSHEIGHPLEKVWQHHGKVLNAFVSIAIPYPPLSLRQELLSGKKLQDDLNDVP